MLSVCTLNPSILTLASQMSAISITVDATGSSHNSNDCPVELSFIGESRPWTIKDFKGTYHVLTNVIALPFDVEE